MDELDKIEKAIAELRGEMLAMNCLLMSITRLSTSAQRATLAGELAQEAEMALAHLLASPLNEAGIAAFDRTIKGLADTLRS